MNKNILKKLIIVFVLFFILFPVDIALGECKEGGVISDKGLMSGICEICYTKGDCYFTDISTIAFNAYNFMRNTIAFPIAVFMVIIGGGMMIFSGGSKKLAEMGRKTFQTAIVGFLIVFGVGLILNSFLLAIMGTTGLSWQQFVISAFSGNLPKP